MNKKGNKPNTLLTVTENFHAARGRFLKQLLPSFLGLVTSSLLSWNMWLSIVSYVSTLTHLGLGQEGSPPEI